MPRPTDAEISQHLTQLAGWTRVGDAITKPFAFPSFPQAIAFVVRVAFDAEAMNHHPDLDIRWARVHVALSTHDAGGLTLKDMALAGKIDAAAQP